MDYRNSGQAGYSLAGVMMAVAMTSGLAVMSSSITRQSKNVIDKIDQESHLMDVKHYLAANFSCNETINVNGACGGTFTDYINTYRENGDDLSAISGSDFFKFTIRASCEGNDYKFFYKELGKPDTEYEDIFKDVPISCVDNENLISAVTPTPITGPPNSNLQVKIHDRWAGVCCETAGDSPVITGNACNWIRVVRSLRDTTNGLGLDCPENGQNPVDCECIAGPSEQYHGIGYPAPNNDKNVRSSIELDEGGPIFPNNGRETCLHVHYDGTMTAIYSEIGALAGTNHPNHGSWDFTREEWIGRVEPAPCHHFRLLP